MGKPFLDLTDVISDPDFCDSEIMCTRGASSVNSQGITQLSKTNFNFVGVVTSARGYDLERLAIGQHVTGSISIITMFRLQDGTIGNTADVVTWDGNTYTVTDIQPYKRFGAGWVEAICELIPLSGGANNQS